MNYKLILNILTTVNGGLITGAALFNPLIGQDHSLQLISALGICQIIVSGINSNLSTATNTVNSLDPGTLVKAVAQLPGVDRVAINNQALPDVAAAAVDPAQPKVGPAPSTDRATLTSIAKGT